MTPKEHVIAAHKGKALSEFYARRGDKVEAWVCLLTATCHVACAANRLIGHAIYREAPDGTDIGVLEK